MIVNHRFVHVVSFLVLCMSLLMACDKTGNTDGNPFALDSSVPELIDPGHFTILSWTGIDNEYASFGFRNLKEAGFNAYLGSYKDLEAAETALALADVAGIKMIVACPALYTDAESVTARFSAHSSFLAYHIADEPELSEFEDLAGKIKTIRKYDSSHPCYVNLYPNWVWGGEDQYLSRIRQFAEKVPVKFISFDNYPCKRENGVTTVRKDWYHNLEDIRVLAREKQIPFWAFALSLSHKTPEADYPVPTIGEIRLQQFSNLVYGATGFQYFTSWGHIQNTSVTPVYERIKLVNSELIGLEPIFVGAEIKEVWHVGKEIPSGCKAMEKVPEGIDHLKVADGNAVVSYLVNNNKQYIAVVNSSPTGKLSLDIDFKNRSKAFQYDKTSAATPFSPGAVQLMPGDITIYSW